MKKTAAATAAEAADTAPAETGEERAEVAKPLLPSKVEQGDDREPGSELLDMKRQRALAEASKPIEPAAEAIWSSDPEKVKARAAIQEAYRKVARDGTDRDSKGELRDRYERTDKKFVEAASDLLRRRNDKQEDKEESRLTRWISTYLTPAEKDGEAAADKATVRRALRMRRQVEARLSKLLGPRETARQNAADEAKRWEKAFGRWSAPDKEIAAVIASYADRIDQLNADINIDNNRDQAIFSFWFEVAPAHLQLRPEPVNEKNAPGVDLIKQALEEFSGLENNFKSGEERDDGSIYLIQPAELPAKREKILKRWQDAAEAQAKAEADYLTRPDSAADLKPRHDKLKDDGWIKDTREALATPKP